jgi:acetyl-CoA C-acetyltransferase
VTEVVIAGIGQTPVGEHWDLSLRELASLAIKQALQDAGGLRPQAMFVGNMLAVQLSGQAHLGALLATQMGLEGIEAYTLEAAGASGGAALRNAYQAVASGMVDVALVVGIEKFTDLIGSGVELATATSGDGDWESVQGLTPLGQAALLMQRYLYETAAPRQAFAGFPVIAHANGETNPNAMFRKAISVNQYAAAAMVSEPLNMFDIAPYVDGAAALVLTRQELIPADFIQPLVRIAGSSSSTDTLALHDRPDPMVFRAARLSVEQACKRARVSPMQVDFFELHDSFSIFAALLLEAAGFADRGRGWELVESGEIKPQGCMPISTMGGLKARGYPGGAAGIYQAVEAVLQLRGQAGPNQIAGARRGMIQCMGGPASVVVTHILEVL